MVRQKEMFKRIILGLLILISLSACGNGTKIAFHTIPYSQSLQTVDDDEGADAFKHVGDNINSKYYVIKDYYNMKSSGTFHIIHNFKTYQQTTEYTGGCAAALMVLNSYGNNDYDEMKIADIVKADPIKGASVEGLVSFFTSIGYYVDFTASPNRFFDNLDTFEGFIVDKVDAKIPVMVNWVDWLGNWQVIIGIDIGNEENPYDDVLIFADPYDVTDHYQDGYYTFPFARFFEMWREGMRAGKMVPYEQPFIVVYPKS